MAVTLVCNADLHALNVQQRGQKPYDDTRSDGALVRAVSLHLASADTRLKKSQSQFPENINAENFGNRFFIFLQTRTLEFARHL
jgi:hypothetical protein